MEKGPRIHCPGAFYYVISRGNKRNIGSFSWSEASGGKDSWQHRGPPRYSATVFTVTGGEETRIFNNSSLKP